MEAYMWTGEWGDVIFQACGMFYNNTLVYTAFLGHLFYLVMKQSNFLYKKLLRSTAEAQMRPMLFYILVDDRQDRTEKFSCLLDITKGV